MSNDLSVTKKSVQDRSALVGRSVDGNVSANVSVSHEKRPSSKDMKIIEENLGTQDKNILGNHVTLETETVETREAGQAL